MGVAIDLSRGDAARRRRDARPPLDLAAPRADEGVPASLSISGLAPAMVYLDGRSVGELPLRDLPVPAGRHRLRLESRRHVYDLFFTFVLRAGEHQRLQLTPKRGTIRVLAHPFAVVTLDGRRVGATPFAPLAVYEGLHHVVLENPQFATRREVRVRVRPNSEALVKASLEPGID
jgi:hypothetical protein